MLVNLFGNVKLNTEICIVKHKNKKIMKAISTKKILVSTGGWGWKMRPINAIAGCNDTGNEGDTKANNRVKRKDNWGFLSFVFEPYWLLILTRNRKLDNLNLLKEYRDTLIKELTK